MSEHMKSAVSFIKKSANEQTEIKMELMKNEWSKEAVLRLIKLYKENECLYNPKNGLYHNKHARINSLTKIAESLREKMLNIAINDVKIKITTLRGQYAKILQKLREKKSGSGTDDQFEPTAYWFEHMEFLNDCMTVRKAGSNFVSFSETSFSEDSCEERGSQGVKRKCLQPPSSHNDTVNKDDPDTVIAAATRALNAINASQAEENKSENANFCNFLQSELDKLDGDLRDELVEEITSLLFEKKRKQKQLKNKLL